MSHPENDRDVSAYPEEDACYRTRNVCVFSRVQKGIPGLTHKGLCLLQRVSIGALSDVTVVFDMRQSIVYHAMSHLTFLINAHRRGGWLVEKCNVTSIYFCKVIGFVV